MKTTVLVMDTLFRFRLLAIVQSGEEAEGWEMQVMCIEQVADTLVSLRLLDAEAAARLTQASTTITPQAGVTTVPLSEFIPIIELVHPNSVPVYLEARQSHVLIAHGETTDEALALAGFSLRADGAVQ